MAELWKGKIPIIRRSLDEGFLGNRQAVSFGAVPRDYDEDPVAMGDSPAGLKILTDAELKEAFDEQENAQSSLEHMYLRMGIPAFDLLDQNGHGYCHTADTEVLTDRGFVAWPDYNGSDLLATVNPLTHAMEFQAPFERHVYEYDGPMIYSTNRRIDFGVTPDHQMYVRKWDEKLRTLSPNYSFVRAADIGWYAGLLSAPSGHRGTEIVELEIPGDRRYDGDDFFALLGLVLSDGYAGGTEKTRNLVSFASFREGTRDAIAALASRLGFKEADSRRGVWSRWSAGALAEWMRANCYCSSGLGSRNKRVPEIVKCASMRQIKLFLHYFDDRSRDGRQFYSTSKRMIDDLQELFLRVGKRSHIGHAKAKDTPFDNAAGVIHGGPGFILTVGEVDRLCIDKKKHIETERYKGEVYCAAVPNHTLITRRNGSTLISSNCWAYSTGHCIMLDRLKQNLPLVRINPHATAAIIKKGRDEGGWSGLSMKFGRENGYAVEGDGPGQWPLHSRNLKYDTPELRASMALHKAEEDWYDLGQREYDQELSRSQLLTLGVQNIPCGVDYNRFGHAMCQVRVVLINGTWSPMVLNSWRGWGYYGLGILWNMWPDNAVALRASTPSDR